MANNYSKILELANKNNMGLSNTIKRDYGIPLDYSSVQENYDAALTYAKTSTLAYIGQPISVGDTLYIVTDEANGYLKAVGTKPAGDNTSIEVSDDGKISIKGFAGAGDATLPRKNADGSISWITLADIAGSTDTNTKTVVDVADDSAITVNYSYDESTDTKTYTLDVQLPAVPEYTVTKEVGEGKVTYTVTKDGEAVGEAIEVPNAYDDSALDSRVAAVESSVEDHETRLGNVETKVNDFFAAVETPDEVINTLDEIVQYIETNASGVSGLVSSVNTNTAAIETLNGEGAGSVKKTVDDAIAAQAATDAGNYATQAALAEVKATADAAAVKSVVDAALEGKADKSDLDNYYNKDQSYNKDQIDNLLSGIKGEYGETADSVAGELNAHKTESDAKFTAIETKQGEQDTAILANANAITAINDETTGILAKAKAAAATDAQNKVTALAEGAVAQNTNDISSINTKIEGINGSITTISGKVASLEQKDATIEAAIEAEVAARETLGGTVAEHTTDIVALKSKDTELASLISANTSKFDNYSTTTEVEGKIAAAISGIDNTSITEAIAANTTAISDEVTRAKAKEDELAGLIADNAEAISNNASDIAALEAALNAVIDDEDGTTLDSIKDLAVWVSEHESEVLPAIEANAKAIETLNGDGEGSVQKIVADAIAAIPATPIASSSIAGIVKASEEITVAEDGTMGVGYVSTDKLVQGSDTLVLNGGSAGFTTQA